MSVILAFTTASFTILWLPNVVMSGYICYLCLCLYNMPLYEIVISLYKSILSDPFLTKISPVRWNLKKHKAPPDTGRGIVRPVSAVGSVRILKPPRHGNALVPAGGGQYKQVSKNAAVNNVFSTE